VASANDCSPVQRTSAGCVYLNVCDIDNLNKGGLGTISVVASQKVDFEVLVATNYSVK